MSTFRLTLVIGFGVLATATGCRHCKSDRCSLLGRNHSSETETSLTKSGDCNQPTTGGVYYGDVIPMTTSLPGIPSAPRPDNELPMPGSNIQPPLNPIPTTVGMPTTGRAGR